MSINHFSTDHPEALWWAQHHQQQQQQSLMEPTPNSSPPSKPPKPNSSLPSHLYHRHWLNNSFAPPHPPHPMFSSTQNPTLGFNLNNEDDEEHDPELDDDNKPLAPQPRPQDQVHMQKEPMFEKPLTPSDVGKLNRLVIPKQHAEKYFPPVGDSVDNKGLTLSFEDELAKCWRFRYSYWNSSQSYVLTKGWSRYVKEKQLDAGDVVCFERHLIDGERLFIGWRRRGDNTNSSGTGGGVMVQGYGGGTWSRGLFSSSEHQPYQHAHGANLTASVQYQHECLHAGSAGGQNQTLPIANSKRLRLFGVNLECQLDDSEPWTPDGSSSSSQVFSNVELKIKARKVNRP